MLICSQKADTRCFPELYKSLTKGSLSFIDEDNPEFFLAFRLICIRMEAFDDKTGKISEDFEYLITSLDPDAFSTDQIKELYHLRWNIETSFRWLKTTLKANCVHSRHSNQVKQRIAAAVMVFNLTSTVSKCAEVQTRGRKYEYQVNFKALIQTAREFLSGTATQKKVIKTIEDESLPIRKNRHFQRKSSSPLNTAHWN